MLFQEMPSKDQRYESAFTLLLYIVMLLWSSFLSWAVWTWALLPQHPDWPALSYGDVVGIGVALSAIMRLALI